MTTFLLPEEWTPVLLALSSTRQTFHVLPQHRIPANLYLYDYRDVRGDWMAYQTLPSWLACFQLALAGHNLSEATREHLWVASGAASAILWHGSSVRMPNADWQHRIAAAWHTTTHTLRKVSMNLDSFKQFGRDQDEILASLDWSGTALEEMEIRLKSEWVRLIRWPRNLQILQLKLHSFRLPVLHELAPPPILDWTSTPRLTDLSLSWAPKLAWAPDIPSRLTRLELLEWNPTQALPPQLQSLVAQSIYKTNVWSLAPQSLLHVQLVCPTDDKRIHWPQQLSQSDYLVDWLQPLQLQTLHLTHFYPNQRWDVSTQELQLFWCSSLIGPRLRSLTCLTIAGSDTDVNIIGINCPQLRQLEIVEWDMIIVPPLIKILSLVHLRCPYVPRLDLHLSKNLLCLSLMEVSDHDFESLAVHLPHTEVHCTYTMQSRHIPAEILYLCYKSTSHPCYPVASVSEGYHHAAPLSWFPRVEHT